MNSVNSNGFLYDFYLGPLTSAFKLVYIRTISYPKKRGAGKCDYWAWYFDYLSLHVEKLELSIQKETGPKITMILISQMTLIKFL